MKTILLSIIVAKTLGFGSNPYYYDHWCGKFPLDFLDDAKCEKKFPSAFDRQWTCPTLFDQNLPGYHPDVPIEQVVVNRTSLSGFPSVQWVNMQVIVVRRMQNGMVTYKYMSSGDLNDVPYETWSSSKIFAMANAAGHLRETCQGECGMDSYVDGFQNDQTPLGDLATIICSYDQSMGYSSNSLAAYFHDIGYRERSNDLIQNWLKRGVNNETMGGNYGELPPEDLDFRFTSISSGYECRINPDSTDLRFDNTLSAFSMAEMTRRIVLFRDINPDNRFPGTTWFDCQNEMYGAAESKLFPELQWGGMTADPAIFVQSALNMTDIDERSQGQWRIFSKLGSGYSVIRDFGEITYNSYSCLPVLDELGNPVLNNGVEFFISARSSVPFDYELEEAELVLHEAIVDVTKALVDGTLV